MRGGEPVWRETGDGHGITLIATNAGLAAIGIETHDAYPAPAGATSALTDGSAQDTPTGTDPAPRARAPRSGTKQAAVIAMLRAEGAPPSTRSSRPRNGRPIHPEASSLARSRKSSASPSPPRRSKGAGGSTQRKIQCWRYLKLQYVGQDLQNRGVSLPVAHMTNCSVILPQGWWLPCQPETFKLGQPCADPFFGSNTRVTLYL